MYIVKLLYIATMREIIESKMVTELICIHCSKNSFLLSIFCMSSQPLFDLIKTKLTGFKLRGIRWLKSQLYSCLFKNISQKDISQIGMVKATVVHDNDVTFNKNISSIISLMVNSFNKK